MQSNAALVEIGGGMKQLIIIGVGGFAREIYWNIPQSLGMDDGWEIKGFLDGDIRLNEDEYKKLPLSLLGDIRTYEFSDEDYCVCAIGTPAVREKIINMALAKGAKFVSLVHKTAMLNNSRPIGEGVIIGAYAGIGDLDEIGDYVIVNTDTHIGHDVCVGDFSCIMAHVNVMGYSNIGKRVFVGGSATIFPHSKIGDDAYIGAGSVVLKRVKPGIKVFGNPAMPINLQGSDGNEKNNRFFK